jgi:hypothetical protein
MAQARHALTASGSGRDEPSLWWSAARHRHRAGYTGPVRRQPRPVPGADGCPSRRGRPTARARLSSDDAPASPPRREASDSGRGPEETARVVVPGRLASKGVGRLRAVPHAVTPQRPRVGSSAGSERPLFRMSGGIAGVRRPAQRDPTPWRVPVMTSTRGPRREPIINSSHPHQARTRAAVIHTDESRRGREFLRP